MKRILLTLFVSLFAASVANAEVSVEAKGSKLPRMASISSSKVNARSGPNTRYPIEWVYTQKGAPIEIIGEYENWRQIKDWQGSKSWVLKSFLSGKRTVKLINLGESNVYTKPDYEARLVAKVEDQVVGEVKKCPKGVEFCLIKFKKLEGWIARHNLYGIYPNEEID